MARTSTGSEKSATNSTAGDPMTSAPSSWIGGKPMRSVSALGLYLAPLARRVDRTMLRLLNAALCAHVRRVARPTQCEAD